MRATAWLVLVQTDSTCLVYQDSHYQLRAHSDRMSKSRYGILEDRPIGGANRQGVVDDKFHTEKACLNIERLLALWL